MGNLRKPEIRQYSQPYMGVGIFGRKLEEEGGGVKSRRILS